MHKSRILLYVIIFITALSCDRNTIYKENFELDPMGWPHDQKASFRYNIDDIHALYSIYLFIEHSADYTSQNIYFNSFYHAIDDPAKEDIFSVDLASNTGRWHGDCSSTTCSYEVLLQPNIKYDKTGEYHFGLTQHSRDSLLVGVKKVGIRLERQDAK